MKIARIFFPNKRIVDYVVPDTTSKFKLDDGIYLIEEDKIYRNEENHPISFYNLNIPQPLKFDFKKNIEEDKIYRNEENHPISIVGIAIIIILILFMAFRK